MYKHQHVNSYPAFTFIRLADVPWPQLVSHGQTPNQCQWELQMDMNTGKYGLLSAIKVIITTFNLKSNISPHLIYHLCFNQFN